MNKKSALKLHNGDEVIVKKTGEVTTVLKTYTEGDMTTYPQKGKAVIVETTYNGFTKFYSDEIS